MRRAKQFNNKNITVDAAYFSHTHRRMCMLYN